MELRSRSRSRTPFLQQSFEEEVVEGSNHVTISRISTRSSTVKTSGVSSSSEHYYTSTAKPTRLKAEKTVHDASYKTSDYSSEEGEVEMRQISQNQKNQIIEDAKAAANGSTEISALDLYRKAGRYWDKYPKTDWTYSPHSRDRVEIAPGVVAMPNMSRRTIHAGTNTELSWYERTWGSRFAAKERLLSNNNAEESYRIIRKSSRRSIRTVVTSFFYAVYSTVFWCFYYAYEAQSSAFVWLGKKLHHLSSRLMLVDTWVLRTSRSGSKAGRVVALCLLPLLLFAGWLLLSSLGSAIYWALFAPSVAPTVAHVLDSPKTVLAQEESPPLEFAPPPVSESRSGPGAPLTGDLYHLDTDEIVEKVLQSSRIQTIINSYTTNFNIQQKDDQEKLMAIIAELREEIGKVKEELLEAEKSRSDDLDRIVMQFRSENAETVAKLTHELRRCCRKSVVNLEPHVAQILANLLNNPEFLSNQEGLSKWLHALFVAKQDLEVRLANVTRSLSKEFDVSIQATAKKIMDDVVPKLANEVDSSPISDQRVKEMVKAALEIYDADKTGLADYAMEPMGGQVLTTRCTENYHAGTAVVSVLGIPLWYPTNSPRTVITPGINPGECWAFQNFPGFLVIKLANRVRIDAFSLEHISRLLVPGGRIDSAPKEFEVYGLKGENDKDPVKIGDYVYDYDGDSIQYFTAQNQGLVFDTIEVRIKSNHGNPNYTCLYRFRVHGSISHEPT